MRTTIAILMLLLSMQCVVTAQDDTPEVKEVDTNALLADALTGDKDARAELLKLSVDDLQAAIKGFTFKETKQSGIIQMKTKCPDGHVRPYWIRIPEGYDPLKSYPAIVGLHGGVGGAPLYGSEGRMAPGRGSIEYWAAHLGDQLDDVFLVGCSASPRETQKNASWWKREGQLNILHFLFETKRQFNIDEDKVFVTGHSDGGSGSFALAAHMPNAFAGYFPMNGHPLVQTMQGEGFWVENLKGKNIYAFNSGLDSLYPAKEITPIYDHANQLGADVKYSVHPENNHGIQDVIDKEIPKFMKEHFANWSRRLTPERVDWTCDHEAFGRCDWLEITEISELRFNSASKNKDITLGPSKVRLGIMVKRDVEQPTVDSVVPESTAEKMGLMVEDVIIELDGAKIAVMNDLVTALGKCKAGEKVKIKVKRAGEEKDLEGEFASAEDNVFKVKQDAARVQARRTPGEIRLSLRRTSKVTIHVTAEMLKEGSLQVSYSSGEKGTPPISFSDVVADKEYVLDCFLKTADRNSPFIAQVDLDFSDLKKPIKKETPAEDEDEF
ncbi:MAG: PDZ domain-containing protein [Planctomycetota bacterium]|jgi:predicted esterase